MSTQTIGSLALSSSLSSSSLSSSESTSVLDPPLFDFLFSDPPSPSSSSSPPGGEPDPAVDLPLLLMTSFPAGLDLELGLLLLEDDLLEELPELEPPFSLEESA